MNRREIAPGAFVTSIPGEKFKRCKFAIHMVAPSRRENATALALLPHLLDRRCEAIPDAMQLSRHLFSLYGADIVSESYTAGANRVVTIGVAGLKSAYALEGEELEEAYAQLACQLLFHPKLSGGVFEAEDVEIEKEKQADYLKGEMNDKRGYCMRQARRKLYGNSPMGIEASGYLEDIEALTSQSLYGAYVNLLQTAQFEVSVCGANPQPLTKRVAQELLKIQRTPGGILPSEAAAGGGNFAYYTEPMDTIQGKLCMLFTSGHITNAREAATMRVATAVLGALPTSRLFVNVREKQGLCYYCAAIYGAYSGTLSIDSGVEHENCTRAADAIMHELAALQTEDIGEEELKNAQIALVNAFAGAKDSLDALENWAFGEQLRGTNLTIEEYMALLGQVTAGQVRAALASFKPAVQYAITLKEGE